MTGTEIYITLGLVIKLTVLGLPPSNNFLSVVVLDGDK